MAFTCRIQTFDRGLIGKAPSLGLVGEKFIARRDVKLLFKFKGSAGKEIKKHEMDKSLKDSCDFLQEHYNLFFHLLLLLKTSIEDSQKAAETGILTKNAVNVAFLQAERLKELANDLKKYLNSLAAVAKGGTGVALAVKRNFFLNVDSLQKYWTRSEIKKAYKAEMRAEKLEGARGLTDKKMVNIEKDKINAVSDVSEALEKLMIETILFVKVLRQAVDNYDLPRGDVAALFDAVENMTDNEQKMVNQIFSYSKDLENELKGAEAQLRKAA